MGSDVCGIAVHIAARVGALASAGEVLVSGTVKDLVAGSVIEFANRGTRQLKGLPDEWRLFAAIASARWAADPAAGETTGRRATSHLHGCQRARG
jgi:class 3 adenylate cyclase